VDWNFIRYSVPEKAVPENLSREAPRLPQMLDRIYDLGYLLALISKERRATKRKIWFNGGRITLNFQRMYGG
jgi:hypothetical protein